jgi:hypothetical protein
MKTTTTIALVLALALAPSSARAEQSADDRAFAVALDARLKALDIEKQNCGRGVRVANQEGWAVLDRTERRYNSDARGTLTSRERLQLEQAQSNIESAVDDALACEKRIEAERSSIKASLANPTRLHSESERLRNELRQELLALLADVRSASAVLSAQSNYDEFGLKLGAIGTRLQVIRSKYQIPLSRGDHKALGAPISDACTALYAAAGDWKQLRLAAQELAGAQAAVSRAAAWEADFFQRQLRTAQLKYADAQRRFADRRATALASIQAATRMAQGESQKERVVTVKP